MQNLSHSKATQFTTACLIFFIGLAIFTINTIHLGFGFGVEESRYILFAQEMLRSGFTPFPLLYGQPYPDYPATHTFLIYLVSLITHQVTPLAAILPSALAASLILAFTYRIAAVHSTRWGIYAILFLCATYEFILLARVPSPDPLVAAVTVISFYLIYSKPASKTLSISVLMLLAMGFLIRGPMGLVIPALVVCSYYLVARNIREFFTLAASSVLLLIMCSMLQLFIAQQMGGVDFAKQVFFMEVGGRLAHLGQRPFYYYLVNSFGGYALAFPVALITIVAYAKQLVLRTENPEIRLLKFLTSWAFIILLVLSFPQEKHFRYIIAAAPAFALIAGYGFATADSSYLLNVIRNFLVSVFRFLPLLSLLLVGGVVIANTNFHQSLAIYPIAGLSIFSVLALVMMVVQFKAKEIESKRIITFGLGVATLLTLFVTVAQPLAEQKITSVKPLVDKISLQDQQKVLLYQVDPDREGLKFAVLLPGVTSFITTPDQLAQSPQTTLVITSQKSFDALSAGVKSQFKIVLQENLARCNWLVLTKNI